MAYYWKLTWMVLSPLIIAIILVLSLINFSPCYYEKYKIEKSWYVVG